MPRLAGIDRLAAIRALEKMGVRIAPRGKPIVMTNGNRIVTIPRHNPVNAITMGNIIRDVGLRNEQFRDLLRWLFSPTSNFS